MLTQSIALCLLVQAPVIQRKTRTIEGWTVQINVKLFDEDKPFLEPALVLLTDQLKTIKRVVPGAAVKKLQRVTLWFSIEYPDVRPTAEYHPGAEWLSHHGRDPVMAHGVEFTNVRTFASEVKRMPMFVLHELAHSYHDQVLGFNNPQIQTAYEHAKVGGKYDSVQRWLGTKFADKPEKAYAMTNAQEYFAEGTEAYFGRNDFFPFDRKELLETDPELFGILKEVWAKD